MAKYLRVKNWDTFQHYKDRNPPWIKLHQDLLTSREWVLGDDSQRCLLIVLMLLAAKTNNLIPDDPGYIKKVSHLDDTPDLQWAIRAGFIEVCEETDEFKSPWPSRHVSKALRSEVFSRDKNRCVFCGSPEALEIDHVIPVSKGGASQIDNLQLLCRICNRKKRTRLALATRSVADATLSQGSAYSETETETETEERQRRTVFGKNGSASAETVFAHWNSFDVLTRHRALTGKMRSAVKARLKEGRSEADLCQAVARYAELCGDGTAPGYCKWSLSELLGTKEGEYVDRMLDPNYCGIRGSPKRDRGAEAVREAVEMMKRRQEGS